jgi:diguanylate cyclase (GGDEF)-like protein
MKKVVDPQTAAPGAESANSAHQANAEMLKSATVMMVDDEPITLDVVQAYLEDAGYQKFVTVSEPARAMDLVASEKPDVLLLDLMMPGVSGYDILTAIRADAKFQHIPVIVLTSSTDSETKLKALELGATDLLAKPVDSSELVLRLRNTLAAKAYLDRLASYDRLTGLYNRQMFGEHMDWTLRLAQRHGKSGALLHINVDHFRKVNEALGPALGDEFLQAIAKRLEQGVRNSDSLARIDDDAAAPRLSRLGGDEFAVLLVEVDKSASILSVARRFLTKMAEAFNIGGHEVFVTCSIGIAVFPDDGMDRDTLVQRAAVALKYAKQQGGNQHCFYSAELNERSLHRLSLNSALHNAAGRGEFVLFYQPKIDTRTQTLVGAEALLRWKHPARGFVSPGEFIPLAEESGLIVEIGAWVLDEACRQIERWRAAGLPAPTVAVNISGRQFAHKDFLMALGNLLQRTALDPQLLQLEITESILMGDVQANIKLLSDIRKLGLKLSLDDFGTGYSSLSYLRYFPINELKIDQSFVRDIAAAGKDNSGSLIVAIIAMARALELKVVAEGVETQAQADFLREQGCDQWQGYFFGRPMPAADFTKLLAAKSA